MIPQRLFSTFSARDPPLGGFSGRVVIQRELMKHVLEAIEGSSADGMVFASSCPLFRGDSGRGAAEILEFRSRVNNPAETGES